MFENIPQLEFDESSHAYKHEGKVLTAVTTFLKQFEPAFNAVDISWAMAKKQMKEVKLDPTTEEIDTLAKEIRKGWEAKGEDAATHGTGVHLMMEKFFNDGEVIYPKTEEFLNLIKKEYDMYYKEYRAEVRIFDAVLGIAGTVDMPLVRKCKELVLDIEDFKSNKFKGIMYDSISRKDGKLKHYNSYMLDPLGHLERCNYVSYAMQLSTYAYIFERLFACKIGRLGIRWIEFDFDEHVVISTRLIPVPYMRSDVINLFSNVKVAQEKSIETNW